MDTLLEHKYQNAIKEQNELLIKIVSVTGAVVKQQLQEEYMCMLDKLDDIAIEKQYAEAEYFKISTADWLAEFTAFYAYHFEETNLVTALLKQGIDLSILEKKYKLRPIKCISQKRELCMLMNEIKRQIKIVDYCNTPIDTIGKHEDKYPIIIQVAGFAYNLSQPYKIIMLAYKAIES